MSDKGSIAHLRETDPDEWNRQRHIRAQQSYDEGQQNATQS